MKTNIVIMLGMILGGSMALAGVNQFDSNEFNSIISDNLKAEKDLRAQLQAGAEKSDAKIDLKMGPRKAEVFFEVADSTAIAVPTEGMRAEHHQDQTQRPLMQKNLKRVSSEIEDLGR